MSSRLIDAQLDDAQLLDSRLAVPSLPSWHVRRHRLLDTLDKAIDVPLVILSAGPGFGKTVLLADWAQRRQERAAWLCPAPGDDEPGRFRALLTSALRVAPDLVASRPVPPQDRLIDFVHWLLGCLPGGQAPFVLAIDDAHLLTDARATDLLDKLVRHGHPKLHLVLAARHDPPLPLHRYRLAGLLHELRTPDLAMTSAEAREVLAAHHVALPAPALNALAERTEGWAAGVRLAAMRMEHAPAQAGLAGEPSFDHGGIGEYFVAEVLDGLSRPQRRLLVETSFLDEVTGPLAEAVTGMSGAGEMLAGLARGNWFVIALDPAGTRFRYHRFFAESLRCLLRRDRHHLMPELAERAAACFERDGDMDQALYWAAKCGDPHRAAAMLVRGGLSHAFAHHYPIPAELADVLPTAGADDETVAPHPEIALATAALRAATADTGTAARELERGLDVVPADGQEHENMRQTAALVRLMLGIRSGDVQAVDSAAARLTSRRPPLGLRGAVLLAQASAHFWHGADDDVDALLSQALVQAERYGDVRVQADVLGVTACVDSYRSRLRHVDDAALRAHCLLRGQPGLATPAALRVAAVVRSVQRADLASAARELRHVSLPAAVSADPGLATALTLWCATVLVLSGKPHEAQVLLDTGAADPSPALLEVHRDILLGEIETSLGRPQTALRHFERHRKGRLAALVEVPSARAYLALDDLESARQCLRGVMSGARRQPRYVLVESMLLDARIADRMCDTERALEMITNALDVAHEELVLPFVLARETFGDLLARHPAVAGRWPSAPASTKWRAGATIPRQGSRDLPVQLTEREESVLAYLATSMTAAEIADEMYLSVNTVKTHLAGIYRKFGVGGRREAVRRAREFDLL
jgi:LuxR family maltose regulon positive regulatory protein